MKYPILLLALLALAGTAHGNPDATKVDAESSAATYLKEGLQHYEAARYEEARESFRLGYEIDPKPEFLFAMGQTERLSGDCSSALVFYRRFLASKPAKLHVDLVTQMITKCEVALASAPVMEEHETEKAREVAAPPETSAPVSPVEERTEIDYRPWHREPIGITLLSAGVVSVLAGGTFLALANESASEEARSYQEHEKTLATAKDQQLIGVVGLTAGSALLTSAALYYVFRDKPATATHVSITAAESQFGASVIGRF